MKRRSFLQGVGMSAALLLLNGCAAAPKQVAPAAAGSDTELTLRSLRKYYATLSGYMRWRGLGTVLATGCATKEQILHTVFPKAAYDLGYSL